MFGISDYGAFCAAILVFLALPGPGTFVLLTSMGQGGFKGGAAATVGLVLGDQVLLWLAVAGVAAILATHPAALYTVQYAGAAYLVWLGARMLVHPRARGHTDAAPLRIAPRQHLRQAFFVTLLNPKAIVFYMAFFPLFIDPARHRGVPTFAVMAATIAVLTVAYCLTLCVFSDVLARRIKANPRLTRALERLAGVSLVGFGLHLAAR